MKKKVIVVIALIAIGFVIASSVYMTSNIEQPNVNPLCIAIKAKTGNWRFGESLYMLHNCIYVSQKYSIPFAYFEPFEHSGMLTLNKAKIVSTPALQQQYKKTKRLFKESDIDLNQSDVLYEIGHGFKKNDVQELEAVNDEFKRLVMPLADVQLNRDLMPTHAPHTMSVAAHVRKGGGFDTPLRSKDGLYDDATPSKGYPKDAIELGRYYGHGLGKWIMKFWLRYADLLCPLKFPPDSFYVQQINYIAHKYPDKNIVVYLFTDDQQPQAIAKKYADYVQNPRVSFVYRATDNKHNKNVVDDFIAMASCDCLIRPDSGFSINAERIGNFKLVIAPAHAIWLQKDLLYIDKVDIKEKAA